MLISELMQSRGITAVTTGKVGGFTAQKTSPEDSGFAKELQSQLDEKKRTEQNVQSGVVFSKHALERISERRIDIETAIPSNGSIRLSSLQAKKARTTHLS